MPEWHRLGTVDPRSLRDARLQSHWAAQPAATVGRTLLPRRDDDSHTSFRWDDRHEALAQDPVNGRRAALRIRDLWLAFIEGDHIAAAAFVLRPSEKAAWYVNHHPAAAKRDLPSLAGGGVRTMKGWAGAMLPASRFVGAADQRGQVEEFLRSAINASRGLIGVR